MVGGFKKKSETALRITLLFIHLLGMLVVVEVWVETESESMRRQKKQKQYLTFLKSQMHLKGSVTSRR